MAEGLKKFGLFFDEIYGLLVLEPDIRNETNDLKNECSVYVDKLDEFKRITEQFAEITKYYSTEVDKEKMRAIGIQNLLKTVTKQREAEKQEIQAELLEKSLELERLKIEYQYLQRIEQDQQEIIANLYQNQ